MEPGGSPATVREALLPAARECARHACGRDSPDAMIVAVRNEDVAVAIGSHADWVIELGGSPDTVREALLPAPRECARHTFGRDSPDAMISAVRDEYVMAVLARFRGSRRTLGSHLCSKNGRKQ